MDYPPTMHVGIALDAPSSARSAAVPKRRFPTYDALVVDHPRGNVQISLLPSGKRRIDVRSTTPAAVPLNGWQTSYSLELILTILEATGPFSLCDEIAREESRQYTAAALCWALLSYLDEAAFAGKRILDFGCGSGASTVALCRMFPNSSVTGVDRLATPVAAARARTEFFGLHNARFVVCPDGKSLGEAAGRFDYAVLCGVFEHLLPDERVAVLHELWDALEPGGVLFIRETPFRWFPVETHTTGLPLINYFPDRAAFWAARRLRKRWRAKTSEQLLRAGIRGGTIGEIRRILRGCSGAVRLLEPRRLGVEDRIDLWYFTVEKTRHPRSKRIIYSTLKRLRRATGIEITPYLELALRKTAD